jgi:hypothetical protein
MVGSTCRFGRKPVDFGAVLSKTSADAGQFPAEPVQIRRDCG